MYLKRKIKRLRRYARRQPPFFWLAVVACGVTCALFLGNAVVGLRYGRYDKFGFACAVQASGVAVTQVDAAGPAAGKLQVGDIIETYTGPRGALPVRWRLTIYYALHHAKEGTEYRLRIWRQGVAQDVPLQLRVFRISNLWERFAEMASALFSALPFAVVGLLVGLLRPRDATARRSFFAMLGFALNYLFSGVIDNTATLLSSGWRVFWWSHMTLSGATLFIALAYNLFYQFPACAPPGRGWRWLRNGLLAAGTAIYLCGTTRATRLLLDLPLTPWWDAFYNNLRNFNQFYIGVGLLACCVVIVRNYQRMLEPDQRVRIRLILGATLAAFAPNILLVIGRLLEPYAPRPLPLAPLTYISGFAPLVLALAWAYAILKHQVLGVEMVLRSGVQYLLARNVLSVLLGLPLLFLLADLISNPHRTINEVLFMRPLNLVLALLGGLSLYYRAQLTAWLDRRFFRDAYRQERLLGELAEQIKEFNSLPEMARRVGQQINAALFPDRLFIYYIEADKPHLTLGYAVGAPRSSKPLAVNAQLNRALLTRGQVLSRTSGTLFKLPGEERAWLTAHQAHLLVPLQGLDESLHGVLILGAKRSEEPYTAQDRRLLQAVARQMAVVAENLQLKARVKSELKIKHNVLAQLDPQQINLLKECPACGACYDNVLNYCIEDGHALTLTLPVERVIDNKYRLEQLIGKGGMGAVYAATDLRLRRRVALKVITGELFGNQEALQRFQREARTSAGLNHPNIVAVYDYGQAGAAGAYLVMELLAGESLRMRVVRIGPVPPRETADWFRQLLDGVEAAHQAGIVHRDLKPDNVLLVPLDNQRSLVKILDFGLAKFHELTLTGNLTKPGMLVGTPGYMAPEQLSGADVDERSDIFAIGVMVVETLTGRRPFDGQSYGELLRNIHKQDFTLPGEGDDIARLNAILQRCLAWEPADRHPSVAALQRELIPALQGCPPLPLRYPALSAAQTTRATVDNTQAINVPNTAR